MSMWPSSTSYHSPCALVLWGGANKGRRPMTRLAWITEHCVKTNRYRAFTSAGVDFAKARWTKHQRWFAAGEIVHTWRGPLGVSASIPSIKMVRAAKRRLPIHELAGAA